MPSKSLLSLISVLAGVSPLAVAQETRHWPLDAVDETIIVHGRATPAAGAVAHSLVLDGRSLLELPGTSGSDSEKGFTVSVWFNPYSTDGSQQIIAGKNRYSLGEREWSLTVESDGRLKAHLRQDGWTTIRCLEPLRSGHWHQAVLSVHPEKATLFLNGKPVGEAKLSRPIGPTEAPITLGGIWDAGAVRQGFRGAVDEFSFEDQPISAELVAARYEPVELTHEIPAPAKAPFPLWDETQTLAGANDLPILDGATFHVIKKPGPDNDQCRWTLGVGLAWHRGKLYASFGYNQGAENTPTEEAHVRVSEDGGATWSPSVVMDHGEGNLGVSHGVFLSHGEKLWAFMGAFYDQFQRTHTRAYVLDETTGTWEAKGVVLDDGFWPMQEPLKMADGNWIMAGARIAGGYEVEGDLPAVAISHGDDLTRWDLVVIPAAEGLGKIWGESTVIVEESRILNISRYGGEAKALLSVSTDHGRTWTPTAPSNLPMATSKPYAGILTNGQRYLVCTTTADTGGKRSPLTIAVSRPGESVFSKVCVIRRSVFPEGPGVSDPKADFSYPYAVEHEGKLYIGYTHKSHAANELAVIPVDGLAVDP